jgi:hypothetical protein
MAVLEMRIFRLFIFYRVRSVEWPWCNGSHCTKLCKVKLWPKSFLDSGERFQSCNPTTIFSEACLRVPNVIENSWGLSLYLPSTFIPLPAAPIVRSVNFFFLIQQLFEPKYHF